MRLYPGCGEATTQVGGMAQNQTLTGMINEVFDACAVSLRPVPVRASRTRRCQRGTDARGFR